MAGDVAPGEKALDSDKVVGAGATRLRYLIGVGIPAAVVLVAAVLLLRDGTLRPMSDDGCLTALKYAMEEVKGGGAELRTRALENLKAASDGRLQRTVKVSNENFNDLERVCQQVCAIWSKAKTPKDREMFAARLDSCLNLAMKSAAPPTPPAPTEVAAPEPSAGQTTETDRQLVSPVSYPLQDVPLALGGQPKKNGQAAENRVNCIRTPEGFVVDIVKRRPNQFEFVGCCVDLPSAFVHPWTIAAVHVRALHPEAKLDIKLEDRSAKKQSFLHASEWPAQGQEIVGGLNDLGGEAAYRICALAVGPNSAAVRNQITVTNLRLGRESRAKR